MSNVKLTNDASRADFKSEAYQRMAPFWQLCLDVKEGTPAIRSAREAYLPKFENEDLIDYEARVKMTFASDHYEQTLNDHVGLVFGRMPELGDDVSDDLRELLENADGEGRHFQVFMQDAFALALDKGHVVILTDYPEIAGPISLKEAKERKLRPYLTMYGANDVVNWKVATVGGVRVIVQITFRERHEVETASYGVESVFQYRTLKQEVLRDEYGTATGLGTISWELHREMTASSGQSTTLQLVGSGAITGPATIPIRVIYGGPRVATLESRPHLLQLAYSSIQEVQLESDYAVIMHKCNVPTPVFIGRGAINSDKPIQMGVGIDIPAGGSAMFLEPTGAALEATRKRLEDIRAQMRRQGAFVNEGTKNMTAVEAGIYARQRNARLVRAARSLKDGMEGAIADIAAFVPGSTPGSVVLDLDLTAEFDTKFAELCLKAYSAGALPLEATLHVLATGKLPEDFNAEDVALRMIADAEKAQEAAQEATGDDEDEDEEDEIDEADDAGLGATDDDADLEEA